MTPEEQQALLMQIMSRHEQPDAVEGVPLTDPNQALAPILSREFNVPVEEILAIPPVEGMTLRQQLERMRPRTGGVEWGIDGDMITGEVKF